jgi:hypothetical protein
MGLIIDSATRFLEFEHATEDDAQLFSQIKEWPILSHISNTFLAWMSMRRWHLRCYDSFSNTPSR